MSEDSRREFIKKAAITTAATLIGPTVRVLGANDRVRFGLIGAGGRGHAIFRAALRSPNTEAVGVADVYTRRREQVKQIVPGIQTYSDFRRLLDDKSVDAVLIATPQHQHALNFVPALQAGKDVYQEKTMAFNPDHARRMRAAMQGSKSIVQVGIQSVSGPAYLRANELATSDRLGTVTSVHTHHYRNARDGGWLRSIPSDCNTDNVEWKAFEGESAPHAFDPQRYVNWRFFWDYSGGNVFENMVHQVGFWYKVLKLNVPRSVTMVGFNYFSPEMEVPDTMNVSMDQPENLLFTWNSGFGNDFYGEDGNDAVLGNRGTILRTAENVSYLPQGRHSAAASAEPGAQTSSKPDIVGGSNDTNLHMDNFFDCVRSRKEPNCPFELGYRSAIACQMAIASLRRKRTVRWDAEREDIL
ncbi:MAG TPA: Gfo/Idh/MocA family oxidoreductase [Candidatus Acidoferrum sp.]|nr:Gfo/Idh/MocA family oxidoreductase [Candidatus Acidoferrum sp.]